MSDILVRLPADLERAATAQAEAMGVTLPEYITTVLAARVGAQAEAERFFAARTARVVPGRAKEILARAGIGNPPRPDDVIEDEDDQP